MNYVDRFFKLKCSGDVMRVVAPLNKAAKEISESMSAIKYLRGFALSNPMGLDLLDLCAGNALTSLIAVHLLPIRQAFAVDKRPRKREWNKANRFEYIVGDVREIQPRDITRKSIICAIHPCGNLASDIVNLYNRAQKIQSMILMPCCIDKLEGPFRSSVLKKVGKHHAWTLQLASRCVGNVRFTVDEHCMSPRNGTIIASKV